MNVELLIGAAVISAMPTLAIAILGFTLRGNRDLSVLLAARDAMEKRMDGCEAEIKRFDDYRVSAAEKFLNRDDHILETTRTDTKLDHLNERLAILEKNSQ